MSSKLRVILLVAVAGAVALIVAWMNPFRADSRSGQKIPGDSVVRYSTDDFVAACRVRPEKLIKHDYFGSLPIGTFLPDRLSLGRLDAIGVEELVVFCGPAPDRDGQEDLEWAAAARTSQAIDLETVSRQWRQSLVPQDEPEVRPTAITITDCECFRVPADTFLAPARKYGKLRFTDLAGAVVERGSNIGRVYDDRTYIEGATKSSAIFTLEQVDEGDLVDGQLPLELRPDVFLTRFQEHAAGQIELRNPDNGLLSEPITFAAKSYLNHRLNVPRKLIAVDAKGRRQVDLLKDFVSKGRLEVILAATEAGAYLGVGPHDLNVRPKAFEYVFVQDREIVVAQSANTLKKMLSAVAAPGRLAGRLAEPKADIVIIAGVRDQSQRAALRRLTRTIGDNPLLTLLGDELADLTATLSVNDRASARVTAEFVNRQAARKAVSQFNDLIRRTKEDAHANIQHALGRLDTMGSLTTLGLGGVLMSFPEHRATALARESELLAMIDDSLDNLQVESDGKVLTLEWKQPASLSQLSNAGRFALANMEEVLARDLFERERFDHGDEMFQRVTDRFPHVPRAWFRRAHHLSYNTSIEFDGFENRYAWVRRGVDVLLDGVEQNPDTTDLVWLTAMFIGWKVGSADERTTYRELFSQDERLHQRLARIVDLAAARSPDKKVDNWLVAKLLFEHCIDHQTKSPATSTIPPLLFFSRPAAAGAGYAQSLSEAGLWSEALQAWKEAERLHVELGDRTIPLGGSQNLRLNDSEAKEAQAARKRIQYDYWLMRCKLEQTAKVQLARKLSQEAAEHARRSETAKAYDFYRQSLQALSEVHQQQPTQMALFAVEFKHLAAGYRKVAQQLAETGEPPAILTLIEESQPVFPLLDLPEAGTSLK